jgi:hypothetical protein
MNGCPRENWTYMIMSEYKDNLLILPKSLFKVDKVVTWAEPGIKRG